MDVLNKFLQAEINSKEYYNSITNFINLYEIRKGEFEGNEYVIMKVDRENFIIFPEYDDGKNGRQIPFSFSIYKNRLLDAINSYAQEKNYIIKDQLQMLNYKVVSALNIIYQYLKLLISVLK